jgi:hypothetical protein
MVATVSRIRCSSSEGNERVGGGPGRRGSRAGGYSLARAVRAIQINAWGGPEVLELVELPVPEPAADEC